jgi:hypothetical protein
MAMLRKKEEERRSRPPQILSFSTQIFSEPNNFLDP